MLDEESNSLFRVIAQVLGNPPSNGSGDFKAMISDASEPYSSYAKAISSLDSASLHSSIEELASRAEEQNSFESWFNLGLLVQSLSFSQDAIGYYQQSLNIAEAQEDGNKAADALDRLGGIYAQAEGWEQACLCYEQGLWHLQKEQEMQKSAAI